MWRVPGAGTMRGFLVIIFCDQVALLGIMFGVGELVTRANVGISQRINSAFGIPWLAVLGILLLMRRRRQVGAGRRATVE